MIPVLVLENRRDEGRKVFADYYAMFVRAKGVRNTDPALTIGRRKAFVEFCATYHRAADVYVKKCVATPNAAGTPALQTEGLNMEKALIKDTRQHQNIEKDKAHVTEPLNSTLVTTTKSVDSHWK